MRATIGFVAVGLTVASVATHAQTTTLVYQGDVMTGTSTTVLGLNSQGTPIISSPIPTLGAFDADITLTGSLAKNNLAISGFVVDVTLNNGTIFSFQNLGNGLAGLTSTDIPGAITTTETSVCTTETSTTSGCMNLTTKGNSVSGATFNLTDFEAHTGEGMTLSIGPNGDSFSYSATLRSGISCTGGNVFGAYVGPAGGLPCSVNVSNSRAGTWVSATTNAPEIDPTFAVSGLALLFGSVAIARGRRSHPDHRHLTAYPQMQRGKND
jgi:hypothetical protein